MSDALVDLADAASARPAGLTTPTVAPGTGPRGARVETYSAVELDATAETIEEAQHHSGMIPWFAGGHGDPWNHAEAAMALTATGRIGAAVRAYEWLRGTQRTDGAWHAYYASDESVEESRLDTNVVAYVAAGVWHHFIATGDRGFLETMWLVVDSAISWVVARQLPGGELTWSIDPDGTAGEFALLAASSSACTSLGAALACARELGLERPDWERAARRLAGAVADRPDAFASKAEFAMDWYYPVLCGAISGRAAAERIDGAWGTWVVPGRGVLCKSDSRWVTTAETAEFAMACARLGRAEDAERVLGWTRAHRREDGAYLTGLVHPEGSEFPAGERSTYSAAAVVLAADLLMGSPATGALFGGQARGTDPDVSTVGAVAARTSPPDRRARGLSASANRT